MPPRGGEEGKEGPSQGPRVSGRQRGHWGTLLVQGHGDGPHLRHQPSLLGFKSYLEGGLGQLSTAGVDPLVMS